jgi:hypothetical protein
MLAEDVGELRVTVLGLVSERTRERKAEKMKCFDSVVKGIQNGGVGGSENKNRMIEELGVVVDQSLEIDFEGEPRDTAEILDGVNSVNTRQFIPLIGGRLLDVEPEQPSADSDSACPSEFTADDLSVKSVALGPFKFDAPSKRRSQSYRKNPTKPLPLKFQTSKKQKPVPRRPPRIHLTDDEKNSDSSALSERFIGTSMIKCPICDTNLDPKGNSSYVNRHIDTCLQTFKPDEKKCSDFALKRRNLDKDSKNQHKKVRQNFGNNETKSKILEFLGNN